MRSRILLLGLALLLSLTAQAQWRWSHGRFTVRCGRTYGRRLYPLRLPALQERHRTLRVLTLDGKIIESEGLTPDIEVDLDIDQFKANGRDTQLDRALQFIRTGQ